MQVDSLANGRNQPFYHVIADDGHPRCTHTILSYYLILNYFPDVAQENILPVSPSKEIISSLYKSLSTFSRYFVDLKIDEATGQGRLLPSKELQDAYPEDDQFAACWIHDRA